MNLMTIESEIEIEKDEKWQGTEAGVAKLPTIGGNPIPNPPQRPYMIPYHE